MEIIQGGIELIDEIWPLWEKLNAFHLAKSVHYKERYKNFTVVQRKQGMMKSCETNEIRIFLLKDKWGEVWGYCVAFLEREYSSKGHIESLYVDTDLRGQGFGKKLMQEALAWLEENQAQSILLDVAYGNDEVLKFYEQCGFYPKFVTLEKR